MRDLGEDSCVWSIRILWSVCAVQYRADYIQGSAYTGQKWWAVHFFDHFSLQVESKTEGISLHSFCHLTFAWDEPCLKLINSNGEWQIFWIQKLQWNRSLMWRRAETKLPRCQYPPSKGSACIITFKKGNSVYATLRRRKEGLFNHHVEYMDNLYLLNVM